MAECGAVVQREFDKVEVGESIYRHRPTGSNRLLEGLHSPSTENGLPHRIDSRLCFQPSDGFVDTRVCVGTILDVERLREVVLQTIGPLPCKLFIVGRAENNLCRTLVPQQGLLEVAIHFGGEGEALGQVVEVEVAQQLPVLVAEKWHFFEGPHGLGLQTVVVREAPPMLVLAVMVCLVVRRTFVAVGIRQREILYVIEVRREGRLSRAVLMDVGEG